MYPCPESPTICNAEHAYHAVRVPTLLTSEEGGAEDAVVSEISMNDCMLLVDTSK